ncbi:hypothetical protein Ocin01_07968 [Orchesella cincta]|uniref:Uncharacterized protein n=1 Tax=Orchesella cincta TaxID=48709 RepID=A0A1D2N096_ORCCI|nr:hypothetical protein Ocin01_07968 [Orchesella cincta]
MGYVVILVLILCQVITIISSPLMWAAFNERWTKMEEDITGVKGHLERSKRAIVAFAPHLTFQHKPGQIIERAQYGDACNTSYYENSTKLVYDAAEEEDDDEQGTKVNATAIQLLDWLKFVIANGTMPPNNVSRSWLQVVCFGWYPLVCTTEGGTGAPTCRCVNSSKIDTPSRHHPHHMHEGGRCRVAPGGFCRIHPQYKSWAKCARNGQCVNNTCTLVGISSAVSTMMWQCFQLVLISVITRVFSVRF